MVDAFTVTFNQMLQILLLLVIGYILNKTCIISRAAEGVLSNFVRLLFVPSMVLYSNMMECKIASLAAYFSWCLYGLFFYTASLFLAYPLSKFFSPNDQYQQRVYRYALTFPNNAAVGIPLILSFFGVKGLFQYGLFTFGGTILTYSWGIAQLQPSREKNSFFTNLKKCLNPNSIAMLLGMVLGLLGAPNWMPTFVVDTVNNLGRCYVPVALILVGFSIADYPIDQVFRRKKAYIYSLYRLLIAPAVFLLILYIIKAPLMIVTMTALCFASPCGMNPVVYPAAYNEDCNVGAGLVLISSLGSILTVPVIYAVTQMLFG